MRVLWLCNIMLPRVAKQYNRDINSKEGWLTGISEQLLSRTDIELAICIPTMDDALLKIKKDIIKHESGNSFTVYFLRENLYNPEVYDSNLESIFECIMEDYKPDVLHCFGTEFPHTLAAVRAFNNPKKTLIGIQGLCAVYAGVYQANLPAHVWNRTTFRDRLLRDDLRTQRQKYILRGENEKKAVQSVNHVTGRTKWDKYYMTEWNSQAKYHFLNETLRPSFYTDRWNYDNCVKHSIFVSQGNYPIKGLHYLINALPGLIERFPDTHVYVAGENELKSVLGDKLIERVKGFVKLSSYGKYLHDSIKEKELQSVFSFVGNQTETDMKKLYLQANVFLCPSKIENSPNSVGEAMLLGMPVVCADVGGISSICRDKEDGLLYTCEDTSALVESLSFMFTNTESVKNMCENAREHAMDTHNPEKNFKRLLEIYNDIN